ncbi:hypothetical protein I4U23_017334 [Adineta vaga]|nr:hypothetical protein I4U23_017334 [Adineta vaga]
MFQKLFNLQINENIHEEFVKASANNNLKRIKQLVKYSNVDINCIFAGHTPLQAAAQNGHIEIVRFLLQCQVNLEIEDKDGDRAIHHATFGNQPDILDLLIKTGVDLNSRNKRRQTALHIGVCKGYLNICKILLLNGVHHGIQDCQGDTPLHDAITNKHDELIHLLLEYNVDISIRNKHGFNSIHHSALCGNLTAMEFILSKIQNRQWLVNERKDDGFTALHLATLNGHFNIVELLLNKGNASINEQNLNLQTALHLAVNRQDLQIVNFLCHNNANVNLIDKDGDTCLHEALRHHSFEQLKEIGEKGKIIKKFLKINDYYKKTSVQISCTLIMFGADLTIKNQQNQTPLDLCSDLDLSRILTQKNIEYNQKNKKQTESSIECLICSDNKREIIFHPCLHIVTCQSCAKRMKKCLLCKENIQTKTKIEQCQICSKRKATIVYKSCNHLIVCQECFDLNKSCSICEISMNELCVENNEIILSNNDSLTLTSLQQQLEEIREQVHCPICMDRLKDMIFLCGHGVCQNCGNRLQECPICRKQIEKSIILYT